MYLILLIVLLLVLIKTTNNNSCLKEVKKRYELFLNYVNTHNVPEKFKVLRKRILICGFTRTNGSLGYNINKGDEISICVDGTPNQSFHILIHELAHSTVDTYEHNDEFWKNFDELKHFCQKIGLYTPINKQVKFCGKYIKD